MQNKTRYHKSDYTT